MAFIFFISSSSLDEVEEEFFVLDIADVILTRVETYKNKGMWKK